MGHDVKTNFRIITVSGKIGVGTSTLAKNLERILGWKRINVGGLQREFDRKHRIHENKQGASSRTDEHERGVEEMTKKMLEKENHLIYEAWLSGFMARDIPDVFKVLLICSHEDVRIDRVVNREKITIEEAKHWVKQREEENVSKWKKLYGDYNFWDPEYFDIVIDTYATGPMETAQKVIDRL